MVLSTLGEQAVREPTIGDGHPIPQDAADIHSDTAAAAPVGAGQRLVFWIGSVGLLSAAAIDGVAVLGRHTGFALLGSIELVQVAVVLIASSAMIGATIVGSHAAVHILTERLSAHGARRAKRIAALLSAVTFALFAIGSAWVMADLWDGHERTELLLLPLRWFRLLWVVAALIIATLFARQAFAGRAS